MTLLTDSALARSERWMLRHLPRLVPAPDRADWTRTWEAELWHLRHPEARTTGVTTLSLGMLLDATWLRTEAVKRGLAGTAVLCLLALAACCGAAVTIGILCTGDVREFGRQAWLFGWEAPLIVLVTFATSSRRHIEHAATLRPLHRIRRHAFFGAKAALILGLGFLLSADLTQPAHVAYPFASELTQTLLAVTFSIAGLRWAMLDQQERCKHCLVALTSPAHVGRPSHNLLEWNGTEQACRHGHGVLSSPEIETSWCSHSRWLERLPEHGQIA